MRSYFAFCFPKLWMPRPGSATRRGGFLKALCSAQEDPVPLILLSQVSLVVPSMLECPPGCLYSVAGSNALIILLNTFNLGVNCP